MPVQSPPFFNVKMYLHVINVILKMSLIVSLSVLVLPPWAMNRHVHILVTIPKEPRQKQLLMLSMLFLMLICIYMFTVSLFKC
jgi:hypothetical protein